VPVPPCAQQAPLSYSPDSIWNYEVGEKGRLFDGRLTINVDYYYILWNNVQQLLTPACGFPSTQNAGTAISYGPEMELAARVAPGLTLSANGAYTEAHIRDVNAASEGRLLGATTPLVAGLALENVPRYTVNVAADYSYPVSSDYSLNTRLSATRTGPFHDISYYFQEFPAYTIADLRLGVVGGPLSAYLFANNIADKIAIVTVNTMEWNLPVPSFTRPAVTTPRTMGIDVNYKFR